jgi:hypothetical protein
MMVGAEEVPMIWLLAAVLVVAVFAVLWWASGRARPLTPWQRSPEPEPTTEVGAVQKGRTTT